MMKGLMKDIKEKLNKYFVFMDKKTQYCQISILTKNDLQIQHNPNKISSKLFFRYWQTDLKICMKRKKTQNSLHNVKTDITQL